MTEQMKVRLFNDVLEELDSSQPINLPAGTYFVQFPEQSDPLKLTFEMAVADLSFHQDASGAWCVAGLSFMELT